MVSNFFQRLELNVARRGGVALQGQLPVQCSNSARKHYVCDERRRLSVEDLHGRQGASPDLTLERFATGPRLQFTPGANAHRLNETALRFRSRTHPLTVRVTILG